MHLPMVLVPVPRPLLLQLPSPLPELKHPVSCSLLRYPSFPLLPNAYTNDGGGGAKVRDTAVGCGFRSQVYELGLVSNTQR